MFTDLQKKKIIILELINLRLFFIKVLITYTQFNKKNFELIEFYK